MTEKTRHGKVSLIPKLPGKVIASTAYEVKVPNFFTLPEYDNFILQSSHFEFFHTTWFFRFEQYLEDETDTENETDSEDYSDSDYSTKAFAVYLKPEIIKDSQLELHCIISLLDNVDEEYGCYMTAFVFENYDEMWLASFNNRGPSYDKRSKLTLRVHLSIFKPAHVEIDQVPATMDTRISSLVHDLKNVLLNGQNHDVVFKVKDKQFKAHQDILRSRCDVFCSMLTHDMLEKNSGVINVPDCDPKAFEQLLHFIYSGKIEVIDETIMFELYYAADKYNLTHLKEECRKFIIKSLTVTNVCKAIEFGLKHSDASLRTGATNFFFENVDSILLRVEWQIFMKSNTTVANELFIQCLKKIRQS